MNSTITDQMDQIEKPMCSAATDQIRLRRATRLLPASHATTSSGSQSVMRCDMRPTLKKHYFRGAARDDPAVKFRSPVPCGWCEVGLVDAMRVHDGERHVDPVAVEQFGDLGVPRGHLLHPFHYLLRKLLGHLRRDLITGHPDRVTQICCGAEEIDAPSVCGQGIADICL